MSHFDSARALIAAQIVNSIFVRIEGAGGKTRRSLARHSGAHEICEIPRPIPAPRAELRLSSQRD